MVNPDFGGTKPTMFICGNSAEAKTKPYISSINLDGRLKT
jgi:hypothetical protein